MNAQQLKNAILQEAITGRLVPQDPNDEPASVLLDKIRKEKAKLVKEGKLKKKDLEEKPISKEEIPFEIPESWEWVRIGDIFIHASGKQQSSKNKNTGNLQKFITTSNLYWGRFVLDNLKEMFFTDEELKTCSAQKGDLLVCEGGAGYGRSAIWDKDYNICLQNHVHRLRPVVFGLCEYAYYLIYFLKESNRLLSVGTAMPGLSANRLKELLVPLPPLAEQHRIVAKIEELLPKVEEYGKAQEALDKLNAELPERLKKSILQEAITGKLVPQDPNDEPASVLLDRIRKEKAKLVKEKKIILSKPEKACKIKDEGQFQIPNNWKWAMINDVCRVFGRIGFRGYTKSDLRNTREKAAISISPSNMVNGTMDFTHCTYISEEKYEESPEIKIQNDDILIVKTGSSYGKTSLVENLPWKSTINPQIAVIKEIAIDKKFLLFFMQSPYAQSNFKEFVLGTSIPTFSQLNLISMQIPLPPLAEQHRIVAKIEELLTKIDKLKTK